MIRNKLNMIESKPYPHIADEVFLIKGGRIKLTKVLEDGTELMLDIRKAGDFLGEDMFSEEGHYPVSAICLKNTMTCGFS